MNRRKYARSQRRQKKNSLGENTHRRPGRKVGQLTIENQSICFKDIYGSVRQLPLGSLDIIKTTVVTKSRPNIAVIATLFSCK